MFSAVCVVQVPSEELMCVHDLIYYCLLKHCGYNDGQVH